MKGGAALLSAGRHNSPNPFAPALSFFTARALRNVPVFDHESNRLFRSVVRRFQPRRGDETEITCAMYFEPRGQVLRVAV